MVAFAALSPINSPVEEPSPPLTSLYTAVPAFKSVLPAGVRRTEHTTSVTVIFVTIFSAVSIGCVMALPILFIP